MSSEEFRKMNDQRDREAGIKPPRSPRALYDMERAFSAWIDSAAGAGFGVFENQSRGDVKQLIFAHLDEEEIPYSARAIQQAAEVLRKQGKLFRESDFKWSGQTGQFEYGGTRLVIHPTKQNPLMNPPPQKIEIVERTKRITLQDLRRMSSSEYAEALRNPALARQIEELLHYS